MEMKTAAAIPSVRMNSLSRHGIIERQSNRTDFFEVKKDGVIRANGHKRARSA